jgi:hypothetical protein
MPHGLVVEMFDMIVISGQVFDWLYRDILISRDPLGGQYKRLDLGSRTLGIDHIGQSN